MKKNLRDTFNDFNLKTHTKRQYHPTDNKQDIDTNGVGRLPFIHVVLIRLKR